MTHVPEPTAPDVHKSVLTVRDFVAGFLAGASQTLVGQPLDLVKTYIQMGGKDVNATQVFKQIWKQNGLNIFKYYKGASTMFLGLGLTTSFQFGLNQSLHHAFAKHINKDGKELIPISQIAISGGLVGALASLIYTSSEFCKIQIQMKTPEYAKYNGAIQIFWGKLMEGNIHHVFKGGLSTLLRQGFGALVYFTVYENYIRSKLKEGQTSHIVSKTKDILVAGSLAGISYWLLIFPVDAIKTQVQSGMFKSYVESAKFLWQNKLLFRGMGIAIIRSIPVNAVNFMVFEAVLREFRKYGW